MLLRHSFYYLIARGVPGILSFAAMMVFTRQLTVGEFGRYALILAGIGFVHVLIFQWLQLVLGRFLPTEREREKSQSVLSSIVAMFLLLASVVSSIGLLVALMWPDPLWQMLISIAVPLTIVQAWLQIDLTLAATQLSPTRYGYLLGSKSLFSLLLGGLLAWVGLGAGAPLIGLLFGTALAWLVFGASTWRGIRPMWPKPAELREYIDYGLPLAITFGLGWVISSSDRILIAWLLDESSTGIYAAGYDLAQQSLGLALVVVNTAAYPIVIRVLSQDGELAASSQLKHNGELVITFAIAGAAGLIVLTPAIVEVVFGVAFRADAVTVFPWIAAAAAVSGIKAFHLDIAFQLARQTRWQFYTSIVTAIVNIVMNILLIPKYGILGAAYATLLSFLLAALVSGYIGRRVFPMPGLLRMIVRGSAVAVFVYFGAWFVTTLKISPLSTLLLGMVSGGVLALIAILFLNISASRSGLLYWIRQNYN